MSLLYNKLLVYNYFFIECMFNIPQCTIMVEILLVTLIISFQSPILNMIDMFFISWTKYTNKQDGKLHFGSTL